MKTILVLIAMSFVLVGCDVPKVPTVDSKLRIELFQKCLSMIPKGPESTKYNDWDEVINSCDDISRRQATSY